MTTYSSHGAGSRMADMVPLRNASRISLVAFGMSFGAFLAITYLVCVLYGLAVADEGMHELLASLLPGFTWLTWPSFFLGLIESFLFGWYAAVVFVPLYNWFADRFR
jgi:hypothetical protein